MICHGDLKVKKGEMAVAFFGNLPAYCLNFVQNFFAQVYNNEPWGDFYHPKDVKPIIASVFSEERQQIWNRMTSGMYYEFRSHWSRTHSSFLELLELCLNRTKFDAKYGRKTVTDICSNLDVLGIYREGARVNLLLEKKQLPVLLIDRQRRSVPILKWQKKYQDDVLRDIADQKIGRDMKTIRLDREPYVVIQGSRSG
jgi:hypothetical protein